MKFFRQLIVGAFVLIPTLAAFVINLSPLPNDYLNANRDRISYGLKNESALEASSLITLLEYTPWRGDLWLRLGRLQLNQAAFEDAVYAFEQANHSDALSIEGRVWQADALIGNGQVEDARDLLRQFSTLEEVDGFTYLQAALLQRRINDPYGALANLLRGYDIDPLNGEISYQTGLQLAAVEPDQAVAFLTEAAKLDPNRQWICNSLVETITESSEIQGTADRFIYIGQVLSTFGEWDVAQRAFQSAVDADSEYGIAWALLAEAAQQNNLDGKVYIEKAMELAPKSELVNGLHGLYYRRQGKPDLAIIYLDKALVINPQALVWEIEMGNTLAEVGDLEGAHLHFQRAVEIDPQDWTPWRALAMFSITRNYKVSEIGLPAARQALALFPSSPALMDLLGTGLMLEKAYEEAEYYYLQANTIDPNQSAILIHLGQLYLAIDQKEKAMVFLNQAVEFAKDNRLRELANRILVENGAWE